MALFQPSLVYEVPDKTPIKPLKAIKPIKPIETGKRIGDNKEPEVTEDNKNVINVVINTI